jgi:hypothetical protein
LSARLIVAPAGLTRRCGQVSRNLDGESRRGHSQLVLKDPFDRLRKSDPVAARIVAGSGIL